MAANLVEAGVDLTVFDLDAERVAEFAAGSFVHGGEASLGFCRGLDPDHDAAGRARGRGGGAQLGGRAADGARAGLDDPRHELVQPAAEPSSSSRKRSATASTSSMRRSRVACLARPTRRSRSWSAPSDESFAKVEPTLQKLGRVIFRTGPVGSGHAMKALNNVHRRDGVRGGGRGDRGRVAPTRSTRRPWSTSSTSRRDGASRARSCSGRT